MSSIQGNELAVVSRLPLVRCNTNTWLTEDICAIKKVVTVKHSAKECCAPAKAEVAQAGQKGSTLQGLAIGYALVPSIKNIYNKLNEGVKD